MAYVSVGGMVQGQMGMPMQAPGQARPNQFGSLMGSMAKLASQQNQSQMPVQQLPQSQLSNAFGGSLSGAMSNTAAQSANQIVQSQISPKAFSAPQAIAGVYGQENPGTFTRSVNPQVPTQMDGPIPVPSAIQDESQITPNQGFNNI